MAGVSVNDIVSDWGAANAGTRDFGPAEQALMAGRSQSAFMAGYPALSYNEALIQEALTPPAPTVPAVTTSSLSLMVVDVSFLERVLATGSPTPTWAVTAGTLPTGITFSTAGFLSGTPTVVGAYDFTVTATNSEGSDVQQFTGSVLVAGSAPSISTSSLNALTEDSVFSQSLAAAGSTPITWTVTDGAVPTGLTLTTGGLLSGTPTVAGVYAFTVTATSAYGADSQPYSGTVAAATPGLADNIVLNGDNIVLNGDNIVLTS